MPTPFVGVAQKLQSERLNYPGMLPREIIVMRNWLKKHEADYEKIEFNLRLGSGTDPGPQWEPSIRQMAIQNSQKRVDAVAWQRGQPTIIEVKDRATASAIGQIASYAALWPVTYPDTPTPRLMLISNRFDSDILTVCQHHGIAYEQVDADFSELWGRGSAVQ